jgi:hypothetical protein
MATATKSFSASSSSTSSGVIFLFFDLFAQEYSNYKKSHLKGDIHLTYEVFSFLIVTALAL